MVANEEACMEHASTVLMTEFVTHDVKRFILSKPLDLSYEPGQGIELAIDEAQWRDKGRPFTPTSLPSDRVLEFTIKGYPEHQGMTQKLHTVRPGDKVLLSEPFGTITYQGRGTFIAGGAGVTPFIAILRKLALQSNLDGHGLIFSNKTSADVICEKEFHHYLGKRCVLTCTQKSEAGYEHRRIDSGFLSEVIDDFEQRFYLCGPPKFVKDINNALRGLGASADALVFER
jgi:ferredoxin-NADP reductase